MSEEQTASEADAVTLTPIQSSQQDDSTDSAFEDESGSEDNYGSPSASIYNYRVENGRTYHAYSDGKYLLPNDEREQDRMDLVYHALAVMLDGMAFLAPVANPQRIVDMGTGTGLWALDVGDRYPEAHVIGIDLSPIQPKWVSPNVEFRVDDIDLPWVFTRPLSLVHSRLMSGLGIRNWPIYFQRCFQHLSPGGWVEAQEVNLTPRCLPSGPFPQNSAILQWHHFFNAGMLTAGCNLRLSAHEIKTHMLEAGFVNVGIREEMLPMAPWSEERRAREAGALVLESMLGDLGGVSKAVFIRVLGWQPVEMELFLGLVRREWARRNIHGYWPLFVLYGQKPDSRPD